MRYARHTSSGSADPGTEQAARLRSQAAGLLALQRSAGNRSVVAALQRCGTTPASECACHDEPPEATVAQRQTEALPWLWGAAQQGARAVGAVGAGALAAGLAAGAAVLFTPNTSIVSGQQEALMLASARLQGTLRSATQLAAQIAAMAVLTPEAIEGIKGHVEGIISAVEGSIAGAGRMAMRCSNELIAFRAITQEIRDYLAQPADRINKVKLVRLMDRFTQAVNALAACIDSQVPGA